MNGISADGESVSSHSVVLSLSGYVFHGLCRVHDLLLRRRKDDIVTSVTGCTRMTNMCYSCSMMGIVGARGAAVAHIILAVLFDLVFFSADVPEGQNGSTPHGNGRSEDVLGNLCRSQCTSGGSPSFTFLRIATLQSTTEGDTMYLPLALYFSRSTTYILMSGL